MRKWKPLDALFPGVWQAVLAATLLHPDRWWYQSDLAKHLGVSPSSLQRELARLSEAGILRHCRDGNRAYFQADPECPFLPELQGLLSKTAGLKYVYPGNSPGGVGDREHTYCPSCEGLLIRRHGFVVDENRMKGGACPFCGERIAGRWENDPPSCTEGSGIPLPVML